MPALADALSGQCMISENWCKMEVLTIVNHLRLIAPHGRDAQAEKKKKKPLGSRLRGHAEHQTLLSQLSRRIH